MFTPFSFKRFSLRHYYRTLVASFNVRTNPSHEQTRALTSKSDAEPLPADQEVEDEEFGEYKGYEGYEWYGEQGEPEEAGKAGGYEVEAELREGGESDEDEVAGSHTEGSGTDTELDDGEPDDEEFDEGELEG